jgi:hypothetical protein
MFNTLGEEILRRICVSATPLFSPTNLFVSAYKDVAFHTLIQTWKSNRVSNKARKGIKNLNFSTNLREIIETSFRKVTKLPPLIIGSAISAAFSLEELENKRTTRADIITTREKVTADECFKDARLATALASNNNNLRKRDRRLASELSEYVL